MTILYCGVTYWTNVSICVWNKLWSGENKINARWSFKRSKRIVPCVEGSCGKRRTLNCVCLQQLPQYECICHLNVCYAADCSHNELCFDLSFFYALHVYISLSFILNYLFRSPVQSRAYNRQSDLTNAAIWLYHLVFVVVVIMYRPLLIHLIPQFPTC